MMISKTATIAVPASDEKLEDMVVGAAGYRRTIKKLWIEVIADRTVRGYKDTERVVDISTDVDHAALLEIPVDVELKEGEVFRVGFYDRSAAGGDEDVVVFYEEVEI